jgi:hypothetical protein
MYLSVTYVDTDQYLHVATCRTMDKTCPAWVRQSHAQVVMFSLQLKPGSRSVLQVGDLTLQVTGCAVSDLWEIMYSARLTNALP